MEFFTSFDGIDKTFFICAVFGGGLFIARLVMSFVGVGDDVDADAVADTDINVDTDTGAESTHSFKILTIQGITGFFMMFGLIGLALSQAGVWKSLAITGGTVAGLATVWVLDRTFRLMKGLQSSGNINTELAIGQEGTVYLTIPEKGTGKVHVSVDGRLREFSAVSEKQSELKTGDRVRVVRVLDGSILSVDRVA